MDLSLIIKFGLSVCLVIAALLHVRKAMKAQQWMDKVIHSLVAATLFIIALGYLYIRWNLANLAGG